ncbi:molybdate ABC transporter permease subunit [Amantichitinum ursilacus]|uniref:Molybdenum transport system permease n=1 Tax=Amantichitinum ursilacus TaxID=857265 RepID=A0A0N1JSU4_9NEIS|nr:molybdate ABC transporter permease subunit [Amantichitinum ursilacus]KPC53078.1 Sulfate transport system permease protein CysW [Amantichitinum ursilacus]
MLTGVDLQPLWLTLRLACVTTVVLLLLGVPLCAWLASRPDRPGRLRSVVEVLINLPLVLPPTALGFYLLLTFSPTHGPGLWLANTFKIQIAFSFSGLVLGSVLFSLPFMVQPLLAALRQTPRNILDAARTLGKSRLSVLWHVWLPTARHGVLAGAILAFAHTVGEFGVVLMIGGGIPGQTRVASIALYQEMEALNYPAAHAYAAILVVFSCAVLLLLQVVQRRAR